MNVEDNNQWFEMKALCTFVRDLIRTLYMIEIFMRSNPDKE